MRLAEKKNALYLQYVLKMRPEDVLPGAADFVWGCRAAGLKTALATASRNARVILDLLQIVSLFDAVVDGNKVKRTKPDPEVFLLCAQELGVEPKSCVVFEDAEAGIEAADAAGMYSVGIGSPAILKRAGIVVPGLKQLTVQSVLASFEAGRECATR